MVSRAGSVVLVLLGAVLLLASLFQPGGNDVFAVGLLVFGSGLVVLGVVLPRLLNAEMGPATGFKLTLAEAREQSTGLAESAAAPTSVEAGQVVAATRLLLASDGSGACSPPTRGRWPAPGSTSTSSTSSGSCCCPRSRAGPAPARWKRGAGAVGEAWDTGEYVLVRGPEVSDDTYGLSPAQQHRARNLAVVAAMPVTTAGDQVIAVLAGSSTEAASPLATAEGFDAHLLAAQEVCRVLVDLLQWFPD